MALFKISKGLAANLPATSTEGYCYVTTDDKKFYVDLITNSSPTLGTHRICLNAAHADTAGSADSATLATTATRLVHYYGSTANAITNAAIQLGINNKDMVMALIGHQTSATGTLSSGYALVYNGTGNDPNNYLQLYGGSTSSALGTKIIQINQSGNLNFYGTVALSKSLTVGTTLGVTGATTLSNTLKVTGATTLSSTLGVTGATTFSSTVTLAADPTANMHAATKQYVDNAFAANDAMLFKGTVAQASDLPATHKQGWTYKVTAAGAYAGQNCEIGDMIICIADGTSANNAHWVVVQSNLDGAVIGPASAVDGNVVVFDSATGKLIRDSGLSLGKSVPADAKFTDTTYSSLSEANGGTSVSLVTTGEKYNWNHHTHALNDLTKKTLTVSTIDTNATTDIIVGAGKFFAHTSDIDWIGFQLCAQGESWQLVGDGSTLIYRKNEGTSVSAGTWTAWQQMVITEYQGNGAGGAGSSTQPVYIASTGVATPIGYTIQSNVPQGALFTDQNVTHTPNATTKIYLTGTASSTLSTGGDLYDTGIYSTTVAGELSAVRHSFNVSGAEKAYTYYNTTDDSLDFIFV